MNISVVVPLYNEEESVGLLYTGIANVINDIPGDHEIIFVDDGSSDATFERAEALANNDARLRVVKFRRNYGQTPAMAAGIDIASRECVVTMDGDLQNDPRDIPNFIAKLEDGFDMVVGWRFDRQDSMLSRKIPSVIANRLIAKVTGVSIRDNGCSLKAFRSNIIKPIPLYSEMHRFIPAMASIAGTRIAEIKVRHHARQFGQSKYGLSRIYKVLLDLLTIKTIAFFASRPVHWFALLAIPAILISSILLVTTAFSAILKGSYSLPLGSAGLLFGSLGFFLLLSGAFAELVVRTSHSDMTKLPLLTARQYPVNIPSAANSHQGASETENE